MRYLICLKVLITAALSAEFSKSSEMTAPRPYKLFATVIWRTSFFHQINSFYEEDSLASGRPKAYWKQSLAYLFSDNLMAWEDLHSSSHSKE